MKLDDVKKLHQKKYRAQFGYYLVEGEHLVLELQKALRASRKLKDDLHKVQVYVDEGYQEWARSLDADFSVSVLTHKQMSQISDTKTPQGIIARVPLSQAVLNAPDKALNQRYVYLHEVQDPGNLGTIMRSLAWFGGFKLLLSPNSVDPFNPKVVRSSMGAIFHVPIEFDVELSTLPQRFERFAYLDMQGSRISTASFAEYECYLFGNEARGVPRNALVDCKAQAFTIAGCGSIDSLNLASAVNICAYQLSL
jgi:TrmH family RNA methyltransferase